MNNSVAIPIRLQNGVTLTWRWTPLSSDSTSSFSTHNYYDAYDVYNEDWDERTPRIRYKTLQGCKIRPVKGFTYGGCAAKAIGSAFKMKHSDVVGAFNAYQIDWENGVTFDECKKIIHKLARKTNKTVYYVKNKRGLKFLEFVKSHKIGTFICSLDEHVSCVRNGIIVDSFYYGNGPITELEGWWIIK